MRDLHRGDRRRRQPVLLLFVLSATAVALRFDLRQAVVSCLVYAFTYAIVFLATWHGSTNEMASC